MCKTPNLSSRDPAEDVLGPQQGHHAVKQASRSVQQSATQSVHQAQLTSV